jgi:hydrogenase-4 component F
MTVGESWSAGHLSLILLSLVLLGLCWALPLPLQQLLDSAAAMLVH